MTKTGHNMTGAILGFGFFSFASTVLQLPYFESFASAYLCYIGSNAPDTLEISSYDKKTGFRKSIIPHRTYTHWLFGWVILLTSSILGYYYYSPYMALLMGFSLGGMLHVLTDLPNMSGVPIWHPRKKRKCLKLWKSGEHEGKICFILLMAVFFFLSAVDFEPYRSWHNEILENKNNLSHYLYTKLKGLSTKTIDLIKITINLISN